MNPSTICGLVLQNFRAFAQTFSTPTAPRAHLLVVRRLQTRNIETNDSQCLHVLLSWEDSARKKKNSLLDSRSNPVSSTENNSAEHEVYNVLFLQY